MLNKYQLDVCNGLVLSARTMQGTDDKLLPDMEADGATNVAGHAGSF